MYAKTTHPGGKGAGHHEARDVDLHIEDPVATGMDNNNDSISGSDATVALGIGLEAEGHPNEFLPSNWTKLTALVQEISKLHQWVEAREGQPAESLDCIEWELQNLSLALQPPPSPTPTEPLREVIHQYTDTLCTIQKQTNLTNSLLQDIAVFNEYNCTKLEDWLMYIETTVDLTSESWAKVAKTKLRGLTYTLVTEAINSKQILGRN